MITYSSNRRAIRVRWRVSDVSTHDHNGSLEAARPKNKVMFLNIAKVY